jgi:hypothetical protein
MAMFRGGELHLVRDPLLAIFDLVVVKFKNLVAVEADDVVVVVAIREFIKNLAGGIARAFLKNTRSDEHGERAVDGRAPNFWIALFEERKEIADAEVARLSDDDFEDLVSNVAPLQAFGSDVSVEFRSQFFEPRFT